MKLSLTSLGLLGSALAAPAPFRQAFEPSDPKTFKFPVSLHNCGIPSGFNHIVPRAGAVYRDGITPKSYWFANVTAGATQPLQVLVDTGSAVFWTLSPNTSSTYNQGQTIYDPSLSKTSARIPGETFAIYYGDGSTGVNGTVYTDNICAGNGCVNAVIAPAQWIAGIPPSKVKSGIMGFSFGASSQYTPTKKPTFFESLQSSLAQPVFTTNFRFDGTGYLDLGQVNSSLYTGSLQPVTINNSSGAWQADNVGMYVGGKQIGTNQSLIFDTGSPNTYVYNATIAAYHAQVPGGQWYVNRWQFPCANKAQLPAMSFKFPSGSIGTLSGSQMYWGTYDGQNCTTWMVPGSGIGSFGNPWFNAMIVAFNQAGPSVSFAPKSS